MYLSIYIYIIKILKNKRFNLFSNTLCVQLFYIILYTEDEHFAKTLYEDLGLLPCTFLLFLDRLADTGLQEDRVLSSFRHIFADVASPSPCLISPNTSVQRSSVFIPVVLRTYSASSVPFFSFCAHPCITNDSKINRTVKK